VADAIRPGDVVVTLGAGDITRVGHELVRWLAA
jgi:UDP-N-acetylmuramate-alanine ligase